MGVVVFVVGRGSCWCGCRLDFVVADGGRGGVRPWRWSRSDGWWHESGRGTLVASWSDGEICPGSFGFEFSGVSVYDLSLLWPWV